MVKVRLYNTLTRKVDDFQSIEPGKVRLYCCGPTVYNYAHIGNLKTYIIEDVLRKTLQTAGFTVQHVMNVTDVGHLTGDNDEGDDKMVKSAAEKKMSVFQIADFYLKAFFDDCAKLNIHKPTIVCRATEHIPDMIDLLKTLESKGLAYTAGSSDKKNVYFDTAKFPAYGKMAHLDLDNMLSGARTEVDAQKKHPRDFVLWFTDSKFKEQAMIWDSPWGKGYPGWHLECSAMSMKYLGEQIDIHCGGVDHISVHHTNEIAQSEGCLGHQWVNTWFHCEFLVLNKEKMSKSSGNFLTVSVLEEKGFTALDYRFFALGGHYRSQLVYSDESIEAARNARASIMEKIDSLKQSTECAQTFDLQAQAYYDQFLEAIFDDLNTPRAIAVLWASLKDQSLPEAQKLLVLSQMDEIFGIGIKERITEILVNEEILELAAARAQARASKDWSEADRIRVALAKKGLAIKDTPQGPVFVRVKV